MGKRFVTRCPPTWSDKRFSATKPKRVARETHNSGSPQGGTLVTQRLSDQRWLFTDTNYVTQLTEEYILYIIWILFKLYVNLEFWQPSTRREYRKFINKYYSKWLCWGLLKRTVGILWTAYQWALLYAEASECIMGRFVRRCSSPNKTSTPSISRGPERVVLTWDPKLT